jgi:hypothetical protein
MRNKLIFKYDVSDVKLETTAEILFAIEAVCVAIGEINGRYINSLCKKPWLYRVAWSGYAQALQLTGVETDSDDIFRQSLEPNLMGKGPKVGFEYQQWWSALRDRQTTNWWDKASVGRPELTATGSRLQQLLLWYAKAGMTDQLKACLSWPFALVRFKLSAVPLPCLVTGHAFPAPLTPYKALIMLKRLHRQAHEGLRLLDQLEAAHSAFASRLVTVRKPKQLIRLSALSMAMPVLEPVLVARRFDLSLAAAGRLLRHAEELNLVVEVTGRGTWKRYVAIDIARELDIRPRSAGRPPKPAMSILTEAGQAAFAPLYNQLADALNDIDDILLKNAIHFYPE